VTNNDYLRAELARVREERDAALIARDASRSIEDSAMRSMKQMAQNEIELRDALRAALERPTKEAYVVKAIEALNAQEALAAALKERDAALALIQGAHDSYARRFGDQQNGESPATLVEFCGVAIDEAEAALAAERARGDAMERAGAEQARRADENREWALRERARGDRMAEALQEWMNGHHFVGSKQKCNCFWCAKSGLALAPSPDAKPEPAAEET
jgi:hypothetical protein